MKKIYTYLLLIAFISAPFSSFCKDKKEKEKKLSKKEMDAKIVSLDSALNATKQQLAESESAKTALQTKLDDTNKEKDSAIAAAGAARAENEALKKEAADKAQEEKSAKETAGGLAFKVQVGAYKKFDISAYFEKPKNMGTEDIDGYKKYLVGYFDDLDKAEAFTKDMKKMGVKDAWIVPYKDGARISDEEAGTILGHPLRAKK